MTSLDRATTQDRKISQLALRYSSTMARFG